MRETAAEFAIPVARWSSWPRSAAAQEKSPDVAFVDAQIRRRLSPLARMMLHVAHACAGERRGLRLVFASQHGELGYTVPLLRALAAGEPLSPNTFSLSVHNGAAGLFSIVRGDRSEATALAAGDETLGQALIEARAQLDADPRPVLVVYGDGEFPEEYRPWSDGAPARALALLLERDAERTTTLGFDAPDEADRSSGSQAEAFATHLAGRSSGSWTGAQHTWSWH
ncbi:MAG TPA: beta-ketoacyl synthase chain length factor [Burkholderiales bacterium]